MEIFKIISIALLTTITTILLKQVKPELAIFSTVAGSVILFLMIIDSLEEVLKVFTGIVEKSNVDVGMFSTLLKIVGVGYITEFGANICVDAGNSSMADKIFFAGKLTIIVLSFPIINSLLEIISKLLA